MKWLLVLVAIGAPACMCVWIGPFVLGLLAAKRRLTQAPWRLLIAVFALAILLVAGIASLVQVEWRALVAWIILGAVLALWLVGFFFVVRFLFVRSDWLFRFKLGAVLGFVGIVVCQSPVFQDDWDPAGSAQAAAIFTCMWLGVWTIAMVIMLILTRKEERTRMLRFPHIIG